MRLWPDRKYYLEENFDNLDNWNKITGNGNRGQATIPVDNIRGEWIDLRMLNYEFVILEENGASCEFALDDIYWDGGITGKHIVEWNVYRELPGVYFYKIQAGDFTAVKKCILQR